MQPIVHARQRALIIGLRFFLSVCSSWIQSAPATTAMPAAMLARAVEQPAHFVLSLLAANEKSGAVYVGSTGLRSSLEWAVGARARSRP